MPGAPARDAPREAPLRVGVLALQGSFALHVRALRRLGVEAREVRHVDDLEGLDGLIIPGGESTTLSTLSRRAGLFDALRRRGREGLPMFGTCAGAILLGRDAGAPPRLGLVDIDVERNAYGRQVDSFSEDVELAPFDRPFHAVFIRAPRFHVEEGAPGVDVLGRRDGEPVLLRSGACLLASFHPELTDDLRLHRYFLERCVAERKDTARRTARPARDL